MAAQSDRRVDEICARVAARLARIEGIEAIALGGSRARGTARDDSDIDLGLYYDADYPFSIEELDSAASELDDRHITGLVTRFGDWGPAVNGGGWLIVDGLHVDFLYRDLARVREIIEQCRDGKPSGTYQLGHPMGFQNQIYLGETSCCRPLYDPDGALAALKAMLVEYPPRLRTALVEKHLFDARFEIDIAEKPARRGDVMYVAGCLFRASGFMTLVLYAINRRYYTNEKGAFDESRGFPAAPSGFHERVASVLSGIGSSPEALIKSVVSMRTVVDALEPFARARLA